MRKWHLAYGIWFWWPVNEFLEFLFLVENAISMMNFRRQKVWEMINSMRKKLCVDDKEFGGGNVIRHMELDKDS